MQLCACSSFAIVTSMTTELKTERVQIVISPSELKAIDDWSFANRIRSRSEAIRQLLELGLRVAAMAQEPNP